MPEAASSSLMHPAAAGQVPRFLTKPLTIRIGVTGHRVLTNPEELRSSTRKILASIDACLGEAQHGYKVLSPLAEGADRLVAQCVMGWKGPDPSAPLREAELDVVLPMPAHEYVETFSIEHRRESVEEFQHLLDRANPPRTLPKTSSRHEAYEQLGRYLVNHCDVLIAIWDGKPARGQGGTAQVVEMAKARDLTIYWIHSSTGRIRRLPNRRDFVSQIEFLDEYNREPIDEVEVQQEVAERAQNLQLLAASSGLDAEVLAPLNAFILPHFTKAGRLARFYQDRHFRPTTVAYILSACAVGTAAVLGLIVHGSRWLFLIEILEMAGVIGLVWPSAFRRWQRKWIDYRYLAERLRASYFLYVAGLREETSEAPPDMQLSSLPDSWVVIALREAWQSIPPLQQHQDSVTKQVSDAAIAKFLMAGWIDPQRKYYEKASHANHRAHRNFELVLTLIVILTLAAAVLHILLPSIFPAFDESQLDWLIVLAVTLPAVASAIAGIAIFRHFSQNAERYMSMSHYLTDVGERISGTHFTSHAHASARHSNLQRLVHEADRAMAHEHQGWRVVFGTHLPGPG